MPAPQAPYLLRLAWPAALAIASIAALHPATARAQSTLHAPPPTIIVPFAIDHSTARSAHATVPPHLPPLDRLRRPPRLPPPRSPRPWASPPAPAPPPPSRPPPPPLARPSRPDSRSRRGSPRLH